MQNRIEEPHNKDMRKFVNKLNKGEIKYRLVSDNDEIAKNKVDLRGFVFSSTDNKLNFEGTSFEGADLTGCMFNNCSFKNVFFETCNLLNSEFSKCYFYSTTFLNCHMAVSKFSECVFESQVINKCDMNNSIFKFIEFSDVFEINNTDLTYTEWKNCIFKDGDISEDCVLLNSMFNLTKFERVKIYVCKLEYIDFKNTQFDFCIIEDSLMLYAEFKNCIINQSEFLNNNMDGVIFSDNTEIKICDFNESTMEKLTVTDVEIILSDFTDTKTLQNSEFNNVTIIDSLFPSVDFSKSLFKSKISLIRCNFSGAIFEDIDIIGSKSEKINVKNSTFENARFGTGSARIDNITPFFDNYDPDFTLANYNIMVDNDWNIDLDEDYEEAPDGLKNVDKCFWAIGPYDVQNADYLRNPNNFIIQLPGDSNNYECGSLSDMKRAANLKSELGLGQNDYKGSYECSKEIMDKVRKTGVTPFSFKPGVDFNDTVEYVQFGTASIYYVKKPDWLWDGPIPEPKKFKLVKDSTDKKYFVSKSVAIYRGNIVSDTHCDLQDNGYIYRLEPISEPINGSGGGKKIKKKVKKNNKGTIKKKVKKNNKRTIKKKVKKNKKTMKK